MREEKGQKQSWSYKTSLNTKNASNRLSFIVLQGKKQNKLVSQNGNKFNLKSDLREIYIYAFV